MKKLLLNGAIFKTNKEKITCDEFLSILHSAGLEFDGSINETDFEELVPGDNVKHIDMPYLGTGTVEEISKSGKRVYVKWGDDWDRDVLSSKPYGAYYRPDKLVKVELNISAKVIYEKGEDKVDNRF